MNEDYCSYELSKALKAAGFDEPCDHYYARRGIIGDSFRLYDAYSGMQHQNSKYSTASAPTLYHAQKWLREKCGIHIDVCTYSDYSTDADGKVCDRWDFWGFDLYMVIGGAKITDDDGEYDSYEEALEQGISYALDLLAGKEGDV